ncbi:hypothetical protein CPB84DRAFT_1785602 [Gymnopilus junonius]|uniref:Uncharacterized protein n=1 Tax=Gymnopilus junonius TaxID=109634 RepID=A0A9P5NKQ2_GYMJU|nr:hypothetical protein CPB84DRAFT_1785602 [Gymnopilus junonius]
MKEIISRACDSPLSVVGHKQGVDDGNTELIVSFLEEYWERIRYLDIRFSYINWRAFEDRIWAILARPANAMEIFRFFPPLDRFNMDRKPLYISRPSRLALFNDHAPLLHTFYAPGIKPVLTAPWCSQIRDLSLNGPLPVDELLSALSQMHCLEVLRDNCDAITMAGDGVILPQVTCASLKVVDIGTYRNIVPYMELITHLAPASNCAVSFVVVADDGFMFDTHALSAASQILQMYSTYCDISGATSVSLSLHERSFEFQALLPSKISCVYYLALASVLDVPVNYTQVLLGTLTALTFHGVEKISLFIEETSGISSFDPEMIEFLSSFSFAREFETSTETIQFLLTLPQEVLDIAFPSVDIIHFIACSTEIDVVCIQAFLASRIATGRQVLELHVRVAEFGIGLDMRCLEEFFGLKVVLLFDGFRREYICGSGSIEELII